jgi:prefoldin beta subunit
MEELPQQLRHQIAQFQQAQQQAQSLTVQKQQFELALHETERAVEELDKLEPSATVYKSVGGILIKAGRDDVKKELTERKETLDLRVKTVERQEGRVIERLREMRDKLQEALKSRQPPGSEMPQ